MDSDDQLVSPPPTVDELRSRSKNGKKRRKLSISSSPEPEPARIDEDDEATNGRSRSLDRSPRGAAAASSSDGNLSGSRGAAAEQNGRATTGMERCVKLPRPPSEEEYFALPQINGCLQQQRYIDHPFPIFLDTRVEHTAGNMHGRWLIPSTPACRGRTAAICFADPLLLAPLSAPASATLAPLLNIPHVSGHARSFEPVPQVSTQSVRSQSFSQFTSLDHLTVPVWNNSHPHAVCPPSMRHLGALSTLATHPEVRPWALFGRTLAVP